MSSAAVARVVSVIVVAVLPVVVVAVMSRRRWRSDQAPHHTDSSADCGAEGRTMTAGRRSSDRSPAACADETAANHPLHRIVWIGASR
jgi:hypothetical protein